MQGKQASTGTRLVADVIPRAETPGCPGLLVAHHSLLEEHRYRREVSVRAVLCEGKRRQCEGMDEVWTADDGVGHSIWWDSLLRR